MGAHRKRRLSRVRLPAIGVAAVLTVGTGTTIAVARSGDLRPHDVAGAAVLVPDLATGGPAGTAAAQARDTSLVVAASPAAVTPGRLTAVTARLSLAATGRPLAGQRVDVYSQRRGAARRLLDRKRTDAAGVVRVSQRPSKHTTYEFVFRGRGGYRPTSSKRLDVAVQPHLGLRRNYAKVPRGYVVTFLGSVSPARPGQLVHLQVKAGKAWRTVRSHPVTALGSFAINLRQGLPGRYTYRAFTRSGALDPAYTRGVDVEVAADVAGSRGQARTRRVSPAAPLRLLVTGDSLAFYLGEELRADPRARPRARTLLESRHSTGLARPEFFDWQRRSVEQVEESDPEAVVVWVGGNDCQPLRNPAGRWLPTGSLAWQGEYTRRTTLLMQAYAAGGRRVYWVGMPTARDGAIDGCFRAMTSATRLAAMSVPGTTWLDTRAMFADANGRYTEVVRGVRVRADDGIHLNRAGSAILARRVLTLLHADWRVLG